MPPIEGDAATLVIGEKGKLDPELKFSEAKFFLLIVTKGVADVR